MIKFDYRLVIVEWDWRDGYWVVRRVPAPTPFQPGEGLSLLTGFDHHERGHNRTQWFNRSPTADS